MEKAVVNPLTSAPRITVTDGKRTVAVFVRADADVTPDDDPRGYPDHLPRWGLDTRRRRAVRAQKRAGALLPSPSHTRLAVDRRGPVTEVWFDENDSVITFDDTDGYWDVARISYQFPGFALRGAKLDGILDTLTDAGVSSVSLAHLQRAAHLTS